MRMSAFAVAIGLVVCVGATPALATPAAGAGEPRTVTAEPSAVGTPPATPVLSLRSRQLVRGNTQLTGTSASGATTMTVQSRKPGKKWRTEWKGAVAVEADGSFLLPGAGLPYGRSNVRVVAENAFGSSTSRSVRVYNIGEVPVYKRLVLIDKSNRRLWSIVDGRVTATCKVAIGMPWTPTPTGTFKLGKRHRTPNSYWGPWRLNLRRHKTTSSGAKYVSTKYYIHGTSVPSSIGHMASHGCVRLHNRDIRRLSTVVDGYMAVIRE